MSYTTLLIRVEIAAKAHEKTWTIIMISLLLKQKRKNEISQEREN